MAFTDVILKGEKNGVMYEAIADAAITPGHLIKRTATGFVKHATATGAGERLFALVNELEGKNLGDDYSADDTVLAMSCTAGMKIYAWLEVTHTAVKGDLLESAGDGTLQKGTTNPIAVADEALDLSASAAVATRIAVVII